MSNERIYFSPPFVNVEVETRVLESLKGGWLAPVGPQLNEFELKLSSHFGYPNVLALNSGTAALHLAVKLAGVEKGDKVIIGTFTFVAAANVVCYEQGVPVFMDSEPDTWNLDPELLEEYLKSCKKSELPKAVIVTHIFGIPAQVDKIRAVCDEFEIVLIEDAAEALGSTVNGVFVGSFGQYGALSFNGNKIITSSGGGALVCQHEVERDMALKWATQSKEPEDHYLHQEIGYNYRLSNILAGVGLGQLSHFKEILAQKRKLYEQYKDTLSTVSNLKFRKESANSTPNRWVTPVLLKDMEPGEVVQAFERENIEARRFWLPLHMQPLFSGTEYLGGKVAENLFNRGLCLPSGAGMTSEQFDRVCKVLLP